MSSNRDKLKCTLISSIDFSNLLVKSWYMSRLLRWLFYLLGFFMLLIVIGYAAAQYYKPKILETLNRELKNSINGDFQIGHLDFTIFEQFPNFSIALSDIYLRGPKYDQFHQDFFKADKIYAHVKLLHLFRGAVDLKSIAIKNGSIFIFRTSDGYTNLEVFKKNRSKTPEATGNSLSLGLEKILFENTRVCYVDTLKRKSFDVKFINTVIDIIQSDSSRRFSLDGKLWFGGLLFNEKKGKYLFDTPARAKLDLEFIPIGQRLIIHPSELQFIKSTVQLSGRFDLTSPGIFALDIASKEIDYKEGLTLVTESLSEKLSRYQFVGPLTLSLNLVGTLAPGEEPKIDIGFSTKGNHFTSKKIDVQNLSFTGSFTNHIDSAKRFDDVNSRLQLEKLSGKISDVPVEAQIVITNLTNPQLTLESHSRLDLFDLNRETDTVRMKFISGVVAADIQYEGPLKEYLDSSRTSYDGKLKGNVTVTNGSIDLRSQQKKFDQINLQIRFTEKQMDLDKINFKVNGNPVQSRGTVIGFIPFFLVPEKKGFVKLSVYSSRLDLATLIRKKNKSSPATSKQNKKRISGFLDVLNDKMDFELDIKVDEMVNGPFQASKLSGKIRLNKNQFSAYPLKMNFAEGAVLLSLKMSDLDKPVNPVVLTADVKGADIKKFFSSFNNFSQSTIKSDHLSGTIGAHVQFNAQVDDQFTILKPSMTGEVDFKIKDGKLTDFEPLQKMSSFLLKKRDFTEVQFAEINCLFRLSGPSLIISRMEVESSVLTLFLEGRYSLADSTDLSIQVPLSNLKRRDKAYKPENVGVDAKVGPSVFLRAYKNREGKIVIKYDPFKKFKNRKQ